MQSPPGAAGGEAVTPHTPERGTPASNQSSRRSVKEIALLWETPDKKESEGGSPGELAEGPGVVDFQRCWGFPEQSYKG